MKLLPERRAITSFGNGGFRFGDHSHRGHLMILPSGMAAWDGADFSPVVAERGELDFLLIGTGKSYQRFDVQAIAGIEAEAMTTSSAVHTYNTMLSEGRRVAAALLAVA